LRLDAGVVLMRDGRLAASNGWMALLAPLLCSLSS
jgi:hypothetical protein